MSFNTNEKIEVDPAHQHHAAPARVGSPILGGTTAAVAGKTGNPYYDSSNTRAQHAGTGAGLDGISNGVRGNSIEHHREVDAYPEDNKIRDDSLKKNDIEADVQNGDRFTDSDVNSEGKELNKFQKFHNAHRPAIRIAVHALIAMVMTGWWIGGLILHRDYGWVIPFLLWLFVMIRLVTFYIPSRLFMIPVKFLWVNIVARAVSFIPERLRLPLAALGTVTVILLGTFIEEEHEDNTRANRAISFFGLLVFLAGFYITSRDRKKIIWHTVIVGMLAQFILALFVLRTGVGYDIFNFIAFLASSLLHFSSAGATFLLNDTYAEVNWWVFNVLPAIIFFIAFVQLLYYYGWLQFFIGKFATVFFWSMRVSGAEAVVAAASPFIGQGESVMLIKPFIPHLTDAEIHQVMTSGFATIAGSVLAAYIGMGINPQALISSCVMSIPASLAISKLRYPETEETLTSGRMVVPERDDSEEKPQNALHAFGMGGWLGLKVAGMITASLLIILSMLALVNGLLTWWGQYIAIGGRIRDADGNPDPHNLTIEFVLGYLFYPVAWLLGVRKDDLLIVGKLIGIKVIANEFVAFAQLVSPETQAALSPRSNLIATYALCGFGNLSSVAVQIGVITQLAGPGRGGRVAKVAFSALISGVFSTLTSATIAGMLVKDSALFSTQVAGGIHL